MVCFRQGTLNSKTSFEQFNVNTNSNPLIIDFQEEIIKLQEGYGLSVRIGSSNNMIGSVNYRYYEEEIN